MTTRLRQDWSSELKIYMQVVPEFKYQKTGERDFTDSKLYVSDDRLAW